MKDHLPVSYKHLMAFSAALLFFTVVCMFFWPFLTWFVAIPAVFATLAGGISHRSSVDINSTLPAARLTWYAIRKSGPAFRSLTQNAGNQPQSECPQIPSLEGLWDGSYRREVAARAAAQSATQHVAPASQTPHSGPANLPPGVQVSTPQPPNGGPTHLPPGVEAPPAPQTPHDGPTHLPPGVEAPPAPQAPNGGPAHLPPGVASPQPAHQPTHNQPAFGAGFNAQQFAADASGHDPSMPSPDDNSDAAWARRVQRMFPTRQHAVVAFATSAAPLLMLSSMGLYGLVTHASDADICKTGKKLESASNREGITGNIDNLYIRLFHKYADQVDDYKGPNESRMKEYAKELNELQREVKREGSVDGADVMSVAEGPTRLACSTAGR